LLIQFIEWLYSYSIERIYIKTLIKVKTENPRPLVFTLKTPLAIL